MRKREIIRQPYSLTFARYKSNIHVERVLNVIIKLLQPSMIYKNSSRYNTIFDNKVICIKTKDLLPDGSKNYQYVKSALRWLKTNELSIKGTDKDGNYELFTGLILQFKYYLNNEYVKIEMSNDVLKYLLNNKNGFTKYDFSIAFESSSLYTSRVYKLISHWSDKKFHFISLEYLREILVLGSKYGRAVSIKKAILEPAQKELKHKSDVWFEIKEPIKEGRKVVGWKLQIFKKETTEKLQKRDPDDQKLLEKLVDKYKLSQKQALKVVEKADRKALNKELYQLQFILLDGGIKNIGGFCVKFLSTKLNIKL